MMKRVFKISLIVTVVSLLITLVLLPFGVPQHAGHRQQVGRIHHL